MKLNQAGWLVAEPGDKYEVVIDPLPPYVEKNGKKYRKFTQGPSKQMLMHNDGLPMGIVVHYNAGLNGERTIKGFKTWPSSTSSHGIILRNGTVIQCAPFGGRLTTGKHDPKNPPYITHHAGLRAYEKKPVINGVKWTNPNKFTIGLDLDNVGPLKKRGDKFYYWPPKDQYKTPFPNSVEEINGRYWEQYPLSQLDSFVEVCRLIVNRFNIPAEAIVGHSDLTKRKTDPGDAFPMEWFKQQLYIKEFLPRELGTFIGRSGKTDPTLQEVGPPLPPEEELVSLEDDEVIHKYGDRSGARCWQRWIDQLML